MQVAVRTVQWKTGSVLYLLVIAFMTCFWQRTAYAVPLEWIYYIHTMLHFLLHRYEFMNMNTFYIDIPVPTITLKHKIVTFTIPISQIRKWRPKQYLFSWFTVMSTFIQFFVHWRLSSESLQGTNWNISAWETMVQTHTHWFLQYWTDRQLTHDISTWGLS